MNQLSRIFLALTAALLVVTGALVVGPAAVALRALEHAYGFVATTPDHSWLGSHRLDDGNLGFCLNVSKHPPEGNHFLYQRGDSLSWYSSDDSARLADIARTWLPSTDPNWAAGAQLAVWGITGLNGHDAGWYAARAGANAGAVASIATQIRAAVDAPTGASHWVSAGAYLTLGDGSANSVSTELFVDYVGQGVTQLSPGQYTGILSLTGATFDDGSSSREVSNGQSYSITPRDGHPTTDVSAEVNYTALPFGDALWVAQNTDDGQSLLVPPAFLSSAHASARGTAASPLPFAPAVSTETSSQLAVPGAAVHDTLHLTLAAAPRVAARAPASASASASASAPGSVPGSGSESAPGFTTGEQLTEWGLYEAPDGSAKPIPVTVTSSLLGPFDTAPVESAAAPPGAPVACTVDTVAADGPGTYDTPACILPAPGYYSWVDSIDPHRTPPDQGGARILPWSSPFGTAAEVTRVPAPAGTPPPTTAPPTPDQTPSPSTTPSSPPPSSPAPTPTPSPSDTPSTTPPSPAPTIAPLHGGAQSGGSGPVGTLPSTGLTPPAIPVIVAVSGAMIVGAALFLLPLLKRGRLRGGRRAGQKPHARA